MQAAFDDAGQTDPVERAVACAHALRSWAIDRPAEYNLVFTDQIPGYAAPPDAGTYDAEMAIFRPLPAAIGAVLGREVDPAPPPADPADADAPLAVFGMLHGLVSLEINHHLPRGGERERFERVLRAALETLG